MEIAEVRGLIETGIPGCEVRVEGEGCSFSAVIIGEAFEGLNSVKRQQKVLATVTEPLSTGALHAISMKVYTPAEWSRLADSA
ncbi:MAG: BolA/IbaG family iron-sulfur metabolism protein [Methylococcus sp.]|nr:BolA/IbaG family iron-sulfur metabolism protein [Methylococcus sp.]